MEERERKSLERESECEQEKLLIPKALEQCDFLKDLLVSSRERQKKDERISFHPNYLKIAAPMVRYSKLPFRLLARTWGTDLAYTPMIICESFNRSELARDSEFTTNDDDQPLGAQFATTSPMEFGAALDKVIRNVQTVDLNCGCPQKWAMKDGIGSAMIEKPEQVHEIVKEAKKRKTMPVSVKIRLRKTVKETVELVKQAEAAGVDWITLHGRTPQERKSRVHVDLIKEVKLSATVPLIANGDVFSASDADKMVELTGVDGVMAARGLLANPAMYSGSTNVPFECINDYVNHALNYGGDYSIHYHHLMYMMNPYMTRADRTEFSRLRSMGGVVDFFMKRGHDLNLMPNII